MFKVYPLVQKSNLSMRGFNITNSNMKKARLILGISLLPIFGIIYFLDRILVIFMPWIEHANIGKWFAGQKEMTASFIRILTLSILFGIYSLFLWIF